jgi:serpin (serine protease inhibitor)
MLVHHLPSAELSPLVARYAERFHKSAGNEHHVASPLGAWLLLALAANGSTGVVREEIAVALGVDVSVAADLAAKLVNAPHPALASAIALWTRREINTGALAAWLDRLPMAVARGDIPTQRALDAWAKQHTRSLIETFPVDVGPLTLLIFASALATKVSWDEPFDIASGQELGDSSAWSRQLKLVLRSPSKGHVHFIATTPRAGDVAVHIARAREGLNVVSVIAGAEIPSDVVLSTAHELAFAFSAGQDLPRRSLFDLPLGESPLWMLTEREVMGRTNDERYVGVLPAWSARNTHNLAGADFGFSSLARGLASAAELSLYEYEAQQSVMARYHRRGFVAAAVTAFGFARFEGGEARKSLLRTASLRFGHPFAVVAVGADRPKADRSIGGLTFGPWHGVPVFSGWITSPEEADDTR